MSYVIRSNFKRRIVSLADSLGERVLGKGDGGCSGDIQSILLIRLDHLGDVLLTTPAIKPLRRRFPHARITLVVKKWALEAVKNNPCVDRIIVFNPFWTVSKGEGTKTAGGAGMYRLIRLLRGEGFDLAIDFKGDFRNILIAYLSGAKRRISYGIRGGGFLLTDVVPYEQGIHEIDKNLRLLVPLGINSDGSHMELYPNSGDVAEAEEILDQEGIDLRRRTIALHYGGGSQYKRWGVEKFVTLARRLTKDNSTNVLFFGGPYEGKPFGSGEQPEKGIFLMPDMTVCQMAAAFQRCDVLVCNDSGPMHMALAVGTPTVAIFGPTFADRFGPKDLSKNKVVRSSLPCSPCWHPDTTIACKAANCLKGIAVDEVMAAIEELVREPMYADRE
jgi:ADP-heptose:LPS heptosyltransferase